MEEKEGHNNKKISLLKKIWRFIWHDDSFLGWIVSLVVIFLIVKFIFFPVLFLVTGTKLPLVVVESCSMYHPGTGTPFVNFEEWWKSKSGNYKQFDIDKEMFEEFSIKNGFNKGDIIFAIGKNPEKLELGSIIIFNAEQQHPIIHRIVRISTTNDERTFSTLGDNNPAQHPFEKSINEDQVIGKAVAKIPYVGWIKLIFCDWRKPYGERGF